MPRESHNPSAEQTSEPGPETSNPGRQRGALHQGHDAVTLNKRELFAVGETRRHCAQTCPICGLKMTAFDTSIGVIHTCQCGFKTNGILHSMPPEIRASNGPNLP